jgi:hypothetical protein
MQKDLIQTLHSYHFKEECPWMQWRPEFTAASHSMMSQSELYAVVKLSVAMTVAATTVLDIGMME